MDRPSIFILFSLTLLLLIPTVAFNDVFGEKLIVSAGNTLNSQFSAIDKVTGLENQIFDVGSDGFIGGLAFTADGKLIASASDESSQGDSGVNLVSFLINQGEPYTVLDGFGFADFFSCEDLSNGIHGILCSVKNPVSNLVEIIKIDLDSEQVIVIGATTISGDSQGNGLSVSSDGIIYFSNQIGLYTIDSLTASETLVGTWTFPSGLNFCKPGTMSYSSNEKLYASFECQGVFYLAEIDPLNANLNSFVPITRNTNLSNLPLNMGTDAIVFSSIDFDFLTGFSYGTIQSGFDSISVSGNPQTGLEISSDGNSFVLVCDNTSLSTDTDDRVNVTCHDTTIKILSGTVETIFEADDGSVFTTSLSIGDIVIFDSETSTITNNGINPISIIVDGEVVIILPGESTSLFTPVDHYLGYSAKTVTRHNDDDDDDDDEDRYSKYKKYMKYFKEHHHDKYSKFAKYMKYFKDNHSEKHSKYFKYAKYYYEKYHDDDLPKHHDKIVISLVDEFEDSKYEVKKLKSLYNPVDKNNEGLQDAESHLVEYDIKKSKGESKFKGSKNILVTNQFGELTVDIKKAKTLLVPSAKSHDSTPSELEDIAINHFKCYDAKVSKHTPKFEKRNVDLNDQFGSLTMTVYKEKALCVPVDKNSEGIIDDENYLLCYDLKKIKGEPKFHKVNVFTNNQFGPEEIKAEKPKRLCVPSTIPSDEPEPDTAPVLSLLGTNPQSVIQNESYVESGATCLDSPDGNISANVVILGTVDVTTIGSYQITYDCTDSTGNDATQVTRTVDILSGATLTVNVTTSDSSSDTFNVKIDGLTPQPVQAITTGIPFGPVPIIPDTVIYTIIQLPPPVGYITGTTSCMIDSVPVGSSFMASSGDDVICTASFTAGNGGG